MAPQHACDVSLVTLIVIYGFVGQAPFFFFLRKKYHFWHFFFEYRKECGLIDMLMTFPW